MAKRVALCTLLLGATLSLSATATATATETATPIYSCVAQDGTVSYISRPDPGLECELIAELPPAEWSMVYQDQDLSVLAATEDLLVRDVLQVWLRTAYSQPQRRPSVAAPFRSTLRQVRFDCAARTQSELEERTYAEPHARGTLIAVARNPNAAARPIPRGSPDDAVLGAICGKRAG